MTNYFAARGLRLAAEAIAKELRATPGYQNVRVYADSESREGYAIVEYQTPKGKARKFALHLDEDGQRLRWVNAGAYEIGKVVQETRVAGSMTHGWTQALSKLIAAPAAAKRNARVPGA
ncbi:hypothetical protein [Agromyces binzhouensis]|uniref:Uncharacterized protein n=1 Tax=Agromyces binzhouensis TaxID=1817495 RepID=A0A4Q2JUI5_9MICO|nr:hypothetical protein [Agromyces binzhouensis]RXZ51912.1 hypothetical protein ESO86_00200 [Agromyces binzhouensis]